MKRGYSLVTVRLRDKGSEGQSHMEVEGSWKVKCIEGHIEGIIGGCVRSSKGDEGQGYKIVSVKVRLG